MLIRKNYLPRGLHNVAATSFVTFIIPVIYFFEVFVVLPEVVGLYTFAFYLHSAIGTFLLSNVVGNFLATMLCDTSIRSLILIPTGESNTIPEGWHMCAECEAVVPPRSWHCRQCRTCILKRDHHCTFTGCCIGHKNHRYFILFVLHVFVSCLYASMFNIYWAWAVRWNDLLNIHTLIKILFPLSLVVYEKSEYTGYLLVSIIALFATAFTGALFVYHINLVKLGRTIHEKSCIFDIGVRGNMVMVFGKRWYLTWISPFIDSPLPHNGIHFENLLNDESIKGK